MEVDWECLQSAPIFAYSPGSRLRRRASDNSMTNKSHSKWLRMDGGWVLVSRRISARFPAD